MKFRVNLDGNPVEFAVLDGSAHLSNGSAYAVDVKANETVRFDPGNSTRYFLAQGIDPDSWDQWNVDRDQAMGQMASQETREAIGSGNAGAAGLSDLDYYGNWYASNDGSSFWVPDGAGAGWDPYGSGYWGFYGGAGGYVWISGYPWGWLPYRCGTWNYFNSFNSWGWSPGGNCGNGWNNWYPTPRIGNVPPRYRPLPRPTTPIGHPIPGGGMHPLKMQTLIAVDRGPEATTLTPRLGAAPKTLTGGEGSARLLPKTPNPTTPAYNRSERPVSGQPTNERTAYGLSGGQQLGNVPVYRPTAPVARSGPAAPSYSGHAEWRIESEFLIWLVCRFLPWQLGAQCSRRSEWRKSERGRRASEVAVSGVKFKAVSPWVGWPFTLVAIAVIGRGVPVKKTGVEELKVQAYSALLAGVVLRSARKSLAAASMGSASARIPLGICVSLKAGAIASGGNPAKRRLFARVLRFWAKDFLRNSTNSAGSTPRR